MSNNFNKLVFIVISISISFYAIAHFSKITIAGVKNVQNENHRARFLAMIYIVSFKETANTSMISPKRIRKLPLSQSVTKKIKSQTTTATKTPEISTDETAIIPVTDRTQSMILSTKPTTDRKQNETPSLVQATKSAKGDPITSPSNKVHIEKSTVLANKELNAMKVVTSELNKSARFYRDTSTKDENILSSETLSQLRAELPCNDRDFLPQTLLIGDYWVLKNYVRAEHGFLGCHESVTYTTHASYDFLDNLPFLVERWMAPISLAIHVPGTDMEPTLKSIKFLRGCFENDYIEMFVSFHLFFSSEHMPRKIPGSNNFLSSPYNCPTEPPYAINASSTYRRQTNEPYPINMGRNIAREAALTHFVLASDIELYPSPYLVPQFLNMIARIERTLKSFSQPIVFPLNVFEVDARVKVPTTKAELKALLNKNLAVTFHKHVCDRCHNVPKTQEWLETKTPNGMEFFHISKRKGIYSNWEPFFIGTHQDPYYDGRLSWDGSSDKMIQAYLLCLKDYVFLIPSDGFLVHKPGIKHPTDDPRRKVFRARQNAMIKYHILPQLSVLYGTKRGCRLL